MPVAGEAVSLNQQHFRLNSKHLALYPKISAALTPHQSCRIKSTAIGQNAKSSPWGAQPQLPHLKHNPYTEGNITKEGVERLGEPEDRDSLGWMSALRQCLLCLTGKQHPEKSQHRCLNETPKTAPPCWYANGMGEFSQASPLERATGG